MGAVDLARLAGLRPGGVICEIMNEDGTMARVPQLDQFCSRHNLKMISVAALIRHRLRGKPTFASDQAVALLAIQGEVRRIGVNVNQIARALNTAVMEGKVLDLEVAYLDALRTELRAHMFTLREAFEGNLAYWAVEP